MVDFIEIPKGWSLAAPDFLWTGKDAKKTQKERRKLINSENAEAVAVLVWNYEVGEGDILIHPNHKPSAQILENISLKDWITDCIGLLERHLDHINKMENARCIVLLEQHLASQNKLKNEGEK